MPGFDDFFNLDKGKNDKAKQFEDILNNLFGFEDMKLKPAPAPRRKAEKQAEPAQEPVVEKDKRSMKQVLPKSQGNEYWQHEFDAQNIIPLEFTKESIIQGMIYSEILGKPLCKRRRRW